MYSGDGYDQFGWAVFMAGGSLANIPIVEAKGFLQAASGMWTVPTSDKEVYLLSGKNGMIFYKEKSSSRPMVLDAYIGNAKAHWIDARDGKMIKEEMVKSGEKLNLNTPNDGAVVIWIEK